MWTRLKISPDTLLKEIQFFLLITVVSISVARGVGGGNVVGPIDPRSINKYKIRTSVSSIDHWFSRQLSYYVHPRIMIVVINYCRVVEYDMMVVL